MSSWGWQDGMLPRPNAPVWRMDTLRNRLHEEVAASNTVVPWIALVGAWARIP